MRILAFLIIVMVAAITIEAHINGSARSQAGSAGLETADAAFKDAKFAEAEKLYAKVAAQDPKNYRAVLQLGRISLLRNKLAEAQKWLTAAVALNADETTPKALLAEVYYRMDAFDRAAPFFAAVGREAKSKKLASFKNAVPYQIEGGPQVSHLKFVHTDPLPLLRVKVNGSDEVNFLIDTGGGEVLIDTEFAKKIGAAVQHQPVGTGSGRVKRPFQFRDLNGHARHRDKMQWFGHGLLEEQEILAVILL